MSEELEALIVSGKELDQKLVAGLLRPYLRLDKDECSIRPIEGWNGLRASMKILIYLLARKAMVALKFEIQEESTSVTEVVRDTGVKEGTVKPALRKMLSDRLIAQSKDKKYFVPNYSIEKVKMLLDGGNK